MNVNLLVVGYIEQHLKDLKRCAPGIEITVVEEPTLLPKAPLPGVLIVEGRYQQWEEATQVVQGLGNRFDAVIPLREYGVPAANDIAESLGLPRIGALASRCFRDKFLLRTTLAGLSLAQFSQPQFAPVRSEDDLRAFFAEHGPCVIKPSNKQATVGVFKIRDAGEIASFYGASTGADEPGRLATDRSLQWSYHAETLIPGQEYSSELFVHEGRILFCNVTKKATSDGPCPYEIGHVLPVSLFDKLTHERIAAACEELIDATHVGTAVLHAEWMLNDTGVYLIECAGRPPGDHITELISNSYGVSFFRMYLDTMTGAQSQAHAAPAVLTGIRLFNPPNGIVTAVRQTLQPEVHGGVNLMTYSVSAELGAVVALANNQTRVGYAIAESKSLAKLEDALDRWADEAVVTAAEATA